MKNFIMNITALIQKKLGDDYNVFAREVTKNNGVILHGLIINRSNDPISPTIYLESLYKAYIEGTELDFIADRIIKLYQEKRYEFIFKPESFTDFNLAKKNIVFEIINTEKNKSLLQDVPNIPFLDLSIIFKVHLQIPQCKNAFITIHNSHLKIWNVSIDELKTLAFINTQKLFPARIDTMENILREMFLQEPVEESFGNSQMYVLSNTEKLHGSSCIIYPNILENFANEIGTNFYILPSSVHETILLPDYGNTDKSALYEMVKEINHTEVEPEEILSDSVYYFSRENQKIDFACKEELV